MHVLDPGHVYELKQLGTDQTVQLKFVKRSGGAVQYDEEWPGLQVQEVLRALIDRSQYLNDILPCAETTNAIWHLRMALFEYEARAYRRKQEHVNRLNPAHDDEERPRLWRNNIYADVPFNEEDIESLPIGSDGHIVFENRVDQTAEKIDC